MEPYIRSILGLQTPLEIPEGIQTSSGSSEKKDLVQELYRVDSLFNLGQSEEAKRVLSNIDASELSDPRHILFRTGLGALLEEKFEDAYECFLQASEQADGMESVFFGERAVNVSPKCLSIAKHKESVSTQYFHIVTIAITRLPFGLLAPERCWRLERNWIQRFRLPAAS